MRRHKIRNPVAQSPLLRKGGAHVQSKSGQRQKEKNQLKQELRASRIDKEIKEKDNQSVILFLWATIYHALSYHYTKKINLLSFKNLAGLRLIFNQ